jgi:hypothetical protein
MRIVYDIETAYGNANIFRCGVLMYENGKHEEFFSKKKMYNRIKEIAQKIKNKGRRLYIYAHNLKFDYIAIGAHKDKNNEIFCTYPFIADTYYYIENERFSYCKWIDTCGLFKGSLEEMGEYVGEKKGKMPEWNEDPEYQPQFWEIRQLCNYCIQDCKVLTKYLSLLHQNLRTHGIFTKGMYTTGQISVSYFMRQLQKSNNATKYLADTQFGKFYKCYYEDEILQAYRGGRNEVFKTGHGKRVTAADLNSLYPYAAQNIDFPKLDTEKKIYNPLILFKPEKLFKTTGFSYCIIKTPKSADLIGALPIRQQDEDSLYNERVEYPIDADKHIYLIGSWTHYELQEAIQDGYIVEHIFYTVNYETMQNPFKEHFKTMYNNRKESTTQFENLFWKQMMNSLIGKLAQRRPHRQMKKIDINELPAYETNNWEPRFTIGTDVYITQDLGIDYKRYYAPIYPTLINGWSRAHMYRFLKQIPKKHLWRTSTDSVFYDSAYSTTNLFKYGEDIGEWKSIGKAKPIHQYDRSAYRYGDDVKVMRVPKKNQTIENFEAGSIPYEDLQGPEKDDAGQFRKKEKLLSYEGEKIYDTIMIDSRIQLNEKDLQIIEQKTGANKWQTLETYSKQSSSS